MKKRILLVVMIFMFGIGGCGQKEDDKSALLDYVKEEVANSLKNPDSASFCEDDEFIIEELDNGKYNITGYCKGENSMGVMVGNGFNIIVSEDEEGKYSSTDVSFMLVDEWNTKKKLQKEREEREESGEKLLIGEELDDALNSQDYHVISAKITREEDLYLSNGDILEAVAVNNSGKTIKDAVIAYAGWDSRGYPIKLKGSVDITDGAYIEEVKYDDIYVESRCTFGEESGYYVDAGLNVDHIKAIVVSIETTDGDKWENPYYVDFVTAYENKNFYDENASEQYKDETIPIEISNDYSILIDGKCQFTVTGYTINNIIEPPSPDGYYTYFEADAGNTYIDVKMKIKSLEMSSIAQSDILDSVRIIYDDQYKYYCSFVTEEDNGRNLNNFTDLYSIEPNEVLRYHMIVQVPVEVENTVNSLKVIISVNGKEYKCTLRE